MKATWLDTINAKVIETGKVSLNFLNCDIKWIHTFRLTQCMKLHPFMSTKLQSVVSDKLSCN